MEDRQSAKLRMYINVQAVINKNQQAWHPITAYGQAYQAFLNHVLQINQLNGQLQAGSKSATLDKNRLKENMAEKAILAVSTLKAFASMHGHGGLHQEVDYSYSAIMQTKDTDADDVCQHIHTRALEHLPALQNFGLAPSDLQQLEEAISQFSAVIGKPKAAITQNKSLNEQINELFRTCDKILNEQLDNLMVRFKSSHAAFYNAYFSARVIGAQGSRSGKENAKEVNLK